MAKVASPLYAVTATGRVSVVASFKQGAVWNSIVPQYHRHQAPTPALQNQRNKFKAACLAWRNLSPPERQTFSDDAPPEWTGFQYYLNQTL